MRNKIAFLNEETLQIKNITFQEQNDIDAINDEIKKGNKAISDRQKQIENILAAIQLLKKHIISVNQKIGRIKNVKYNYFDKLNNIENNIK
jgi:chromosome segregation ATPase